MGSSKEKKLEKLVLGKSSFGGEFLQSKSKNYILFHPSISKNTLALIKNNKVIWIKEYDNLVSFDFARNASYIVVVAQLQKKEMPKQYQSGGHIYIITKEGKVKDIKIPCDGLSCSISPNGKNFGITTMGPEWGVYYLDNNGIILWKKIFNKSIGGIEVTNKELILYDKMHKKTRRIVLMLDPKGNILQN